MSVLEMERNLSGVPQQLTMNKMKNGGFAQMLVRCCFSLPTPRVCSLLVILGHSLVLDCFPSVRRECLFKKHKGRL